MCSLPVSYCAAIAAATTMAIGHRIALLGWHAMYINTRMARVMVTVNIMDAAVTAMETTVVLGRRVLCIVSIAVEIADVTIASFAVGAAN